MKIDKNIPLPRKRTFRKLKNSYPFGKMKVNDSFFVECEDTRITQAKIYQASSIWKQRSGKEWGFTIRTVEGGVRCWRVD